MIRDLEIQVSPDCGKTRLDRFVVVKCPTTTRSLVLDAVSGGAVLVNGRRARKGVHVSPGDTVSVVVLAETSDVAVKPNAAVSLVVVHEDASIVALNKPAGMQVHPVRYDEEDTLANGLVARYPETAVIGESPLFPAFVHRIDGDTSGLVLAARTLDAYGSLRSQFRRHAVLKEYTALVHGNVRREGVVSVDLVHDPARPGHMLAATGVHVRRKLRIFPATTHYAPVRRAGAFTIVKVIIKTGVTHQVRCHLAHAGHPVAGDRLYGPGLASPSGLRRHFLHASRITFVHPGTKKEVTIEAPLTSDLEQVLALLVRGS